MKIDIGFLLVEIKVLPENQLDYEECCVLKGEIKVIKICNISKSFGKSQVLKNINLEVKNGEILGLLGENGAGKTTLLKILSTILKPTSGDAFIENFSVINQLENVRKNVGILFGEQLGLYNKMTAKENLQYFGRLYGIKEKDLKSRIDFLSEKFYFKDYQNKLIENLSKGMKQRICISRAIIHDPKVMLFDEPESGLDFKATKTILDFMENCKKEGKSIIFASHLLENIKNYSDNIAILKDNEIKNIFNVEEYRKKYTDKKINDIIISLFCKEEN